MRPWIAALVAVLALPGCHRGYARGYQASTPPIPENKTRIFPSRPFRAHRNRSQPTVATSSFSTFGQRGARRAAPKFRRWNAMLRSARAAGSSSSASTKASLTLRLPRSCGPMACTIRCCSIRSRNIGTTTTSPRSRRRSFSIRAASRPRSILETSIPPRWIASFAAIPRHG